MSAHRGPHSLVPRWGRTEIALRSTITYANPIQDATLDATFVSPSGRALVVPGFWDGAGSWRVRFSPGEEGTWRYTTACSDAGNAGLHRQTGSFECGAPLAGNRFAEHGPLRLSANRRYLVHADGTPFFWLCDTAWNGPLLSTPEEWAYYLAERARQRFTATQWVATHWLASPEGDLEGQKAYSGQERIAVNPRFYQRLDGKLEAINRAGLLAVPVMLWAAEWSDPTVNALNPGYSLPEDQAILLARYMVARWGAYAVTWILPGDGNYGGSKAGRWQHIGRAVFGEGPHAPVSLHPCGMHLPVEEFRDEAWLDITGYQSGHGDDDPTLAWITSGPPAQAWRQDPPRPFINLEPPYENHIAYQSKQRFDAYKVRRALYWSLLNAPTAGVSYGGHGVWGWDDGTQPPTHHASTGVPLPWAQALQMLGAEQLAILAGLFESIEWWRLQPAPAMLAVQPGTDAPARYVSAAASAEGDLALIYSPVEQRIALAAEAVSPDVRAGWVNPRTGRRLPAAATGPGPSGAPGESLFEAPDAGDWVLLLEG